MSIYCTLLYSAQPCFARYQQTVLNATIEDLFFFFLDNLDFFYFFVSSPVVVDQLLGPHRTAAGMF